MCFAFPCGTGIAAHSQSFIATDVSRVLEGARTGSEKLFSMSGLILLFANLQMLVNTDKALYYALAFLQVCAGYPLASIGDQTTRNQVT